MIAIIFTIVRVEDYEKRDSKYFEKYEEAVLGINSKKTLARILPFKTEVADSIKLPTGKIVLYCESAWYRRLNIETPNLIYADDYNPVNDLYLLTITDQNGNPIPKCPVFYFECSGEIVSAIPQFRYDSDADDYEAVHLLLSIKDNQGNLRYVVEKM